SPFTARACAMVKRSSTVTILPFINTRSAVCDDAATDHVAASQTRIERAMEKRMTVSPEKFLELSLVSIGIPRRPRSVVVGQPCRSGLPLADYAPMVVSPASPAGI